MKIKNHLFSALATATIALSTLTFVSPVSADVNMYDNFFVVGNNTATKGDPAESVEAAPENIVEYFVRVRNTGSEDAKNVQVWAALPSESSTTLTTTAFIRPNNPDRVNVQISDATTVNVTGGQPVGLRFLAGHTRFAGTTNKFNCPNVCDINNEDILKGINVGDVPAGKEVQVAFKAFLTNAVTSSPRPTATPTATPQPTVTPTASPTATPSSSPAIGGCPNGTTQVSVVGNIINCVTNTNNNTNNNSQTQNLTVNNPASSPTVVLAAANSVKELPKTGLPLAGLALAGLTPVGMKLRRMGKSNSESQTPSFIWEKREFEKEA